MSSATARTGRRRRSGRHRRDQSRSARAARGGAEHGLRDRLVRSFPGLLGPSRRAAWRRYCVRRAVASLLILAGCGLFFLAGLSRSMTS